MTVELNNSNSKFISKQFNEDLKIFQNEISNETSKTKTARIQMMDAPYTSPDIKDEYISSNKEDDEVSFEERLSQVISTEDMKMLLALVIRSASQITANKGQNVDLLG